MKNKALRFIIAVIAVMMSALPAKADGGVLFAVGLGELNA